MRRRFRGRSIGGFLIWIGMACASSSTYAETTAAPAAATAAGSTQAHVSCERMLGRLYDSRSRAEKLIASHDLDGLRALHEELLGELRETRNQMDAALLAGAWREPARKRMAFELISRLEGVRILNQVNRAFLTGYTYPTRKVSASLVDATTHLYTQLAMLKEEVRALNEQVGAASSAAVHALPAAAESDPAAGR